VKDKEASGTDRLVGVEQRDHDQIVSHLHSLIPAAMPQIRPVRIPGTDRLVIVLRVDADAVAHPVLVNGRVVYRVPGQTVPADRQRVLDLVARDAVHNGQGLGGMNVPASPWHPVSLDVFPQRAGKDVADTDSGTLRVAGGLTLPRRITGRPWLDSRARQAAVDMLNSSPLRAAPYWHLRTWEIREARASTLDLYADCAAITSHASVSVESAAHLNLAGRSLSLLVALRWHKAQGGSPPVSLDVFHHALLCCLVTVASTCQQVARASDAAEPCDLRSWEAWLQSSTNRALDVVDIGRFVRDNRDKPAGGSFPAARTPTSQMPDLDQLARDWLTYWLLEIGTRNFEGWLADLQVPDWIRVPEPGLPM
jgi:hypothetical protein